MYYIKQQPTIYSNTCMGYWTESITQCAKETFKFKSLLPVQELVVHNIMEAVYPEEVVTLLHDREIKDSYDKQLVILPTGTGKSACFQIPATLIDGVTIIIYPLISLINDQLRRLQESGIMSHKLVGGMSYNEIQELGNALTQKKCKCILTNPETLHNKKHIALLKKHKPKLIVVDEAHCISKWGKTFRHSYLDIGSKIKELGAKVTVAFTATASDKVIADIKHLLFLDKPVYVLRGHANRENITYSVLYCFDKYQALSSLLSHSKILAPADEDPKYQQGMYPVHYNFAPVEKPAIVFCSSRVDCEVLTRMLRDNLQSTNIYFYHAGLSKKEKYNIEEWFLHSNDGVLIATCAYGMGVDKANIRSVIHYEAYTDIENFLQETGRAGRDGNPAISIMLSMFSVDAILKDSTLTCRRAHYMQSLGLECEGCSGCDICVKTSPIISWEYKMLYNMLLQYNRCFTTEQLVNKLIHDYQPVFREWWGLECDIYGITQHIYKAIQVLCTQGVLKRGKYLWKNNIMLSKQTVVY